jgi:hypothetical protein
LRGLLPVACLLFTYWLLGAVRWLQRPGWPRTVRWLGAALVAGSLISLLRGGLAR